MARFVFKDKTFLFFLFYILAAILFTFWSPLGSFTATPKFWRDEAIPFEISRTFVELGSLDVVVAPGVIDGRPYLTHATGFPVTLPLAGIFSVFGVGVLQARLYMALWIFATLAAVFFVEKSFFGTSNAILASLLVVTFTPFYANGRTMTGEIPGFFFLILSLYFIYKTNRPFLGGFFVALAAVSKPSLYLLLLPVVFLEFFIEYRSLFLKKVMPLMFGVVSVLVIWIFFIVPEPFLALHWKGMFDLYQHPFNNVSLFSELPARLPEILTHTTILYIIFLTGIVLYAGFLFEKSRFRTFSLLFGIASVIYFLRSPGWFRYLLGYELLLLLLIPPSLKQIRVPAAFVVGIFIFLHVANFFYFSDVISSRSSIEAAQFLNSELREHPRATVGIIFDPAIAALINSFQKYQIATIGGRETYGRHPLSLPESQLPTYVIGAIEGYEKVISQSYIALPQKPGGRTIYKKL